MGFLQKKQKLKYKLESIIGCFQIIGFGVFMSERVRRVISELFYLIDSLFALPHFLFNNVFGNIRNDYRHDDCHAYLNGDHYPSHSFIFLILIFIA